MFDVEGDGRGGAREPFQVPMGIVGGTANANMGPVLDAKGRPLTWWRVSARSIFTGGSFGTAFAPDLSALDLATGDRIVLPASGDNRSSGPGMELDNHHMLTTAGDYVYYHNPFRQARWVKLDGKQNPDGRISSAFRQHDGGGWPADVVYYPTKAEAGSRARRIYDSHGAARTPVVIADDALFVSEIDIRALACYESRAKGADRPTVPTSTPEETREAAEPNEAAAEERPLEDYLRQRRVITEIGGRADRLKRLLTEHVEAMIAAGHLKPYFARRGETTSRWYFTNPGDTVGALARAYPHLPEATRQRLAGYLAEEADDYLGGPTGVIGMLRLADELGDSESVAKARTDAIRAFAALDKTAEMAAPMAARYGLDNRWSAEFVYRGFHLLPLVPEVARYVRDHPAIRREVIEPTAEAVEHWPMWFLSQGSAFTRYYGESHALPPIWSSMIFPVKASIERVEPDRLALWVDAEDAPRGDLFYLERLVLAIEAYGEERWEEWGDCHGL